MKISVVFVFVVLSWVGCSQSKKPNTSESNVVLRGEDYAFSISVPPKLVLDTANRVWQAETKALLYPPEEGNRTWRIGVLIATKKWEGKKTLANLLSYHIFRDSTDIRTDSLTLFTRDKKHAIVLNYRHGSSQSADALVEDLKVVVVFVLWRFGGSEESYQTGYAVFKQVVESYSSVTVD